MTPGRSVVPPEDDIDLPRHLIRQHLTPDEPGTVMGELSVAGGLAWRAADGAAAPEHQ